jgi:hypothetical protein
VSPNATSPDRPGPDEAAVRALAKVAAVGISDAATEKLSRLLLKRDAIKKRFDASDLVPQIAVAASRVSAGMTADAAFYELVETLERAPGTIVLAAFSAPLITGTFEVGKAVFGPLPGLLDDERVESLRGRGGSCESGVFGILIEEEAAGMRGSRRALETMRRALGGLYLAGRASGADTRIGPVPADDLNPAVFVGPPGALEGLVHTLRIPESVAIDVDQLLLDADCRALVEECVNGSADFVADRLASAAAWMQLGFDALAYAEAVLALGIALEALIGSDQAGETVSVVSKRTAFLLRTGTGEARALSAYDWSERTKKLYGERSNVAHGRYTAGDIAKEFGLRKEFEDLVSRVALEFRTVGRRASWSSEKDIRDWQLKLELA